MTSSKEPTILSADGEFKLSRSRDIVIVDWIAIPTVPRVDAFDRAIRDVAAEHGKTTVIVRVRAPMKIPPAEIREKLTGVIAASEHHTTGWGVALEGDGFWAAAHRTFSASMHMLSRSKVKMRISRGVDEAATWACELSKHAKQDILRAIEATSNAERPTIRG